MTRPEPETFRFDPETMDERLPNGAPATSRELDALADRISGPLGRPWLEPGGKSLSGDGTHSPRFQVVLGRPEAAAVKARAAASHMSVSKWLRRLVEKELAAEPVEQRAPRPCGARGSGL